MNSALPQAIDWEARWQQGKIPWDHGEPSQALVDLLQEGVDLIPDQGTVLVPGCGSGYDVYLLAESSPERKVIGLDLSKTCIDQCNKDLQAHPKPNVKFICDDFFTFVIPLEKFSLIFDYTFFCALPPPLRDQWGQRMTELVHSGGTLICLIFPLEVHGEGPPFLVSVEAYKRALEPAFENVYLADCKGHQSRLGREKISIWKRK